MARISFCTLSIDFLLTERGKVVCSLPNLLLGRKGSVEMRRVRRESRLQLSPCGKTSLPRGVGEWPAALLVAAATARECGGSYDRVPRHRHHNHKHQQRNSLISPTA